MGMHSVVERMYFPLVLHLAGCFKQGGGMGRSKPRCRQHDHTACLGQGCSRKVYVQAGAIALRRDLVQLVVVNLQDKVFCLRTLAHPDAHTFG